MRLRSRKSRDEDPCGSEVATLGSIRSAPPKHSRPAVPDVNKLRTAPSTGARTRDWAGRCELRLRGCARVEATHSCNVEGIDGALVQNAFVRSGASPTPQRGPVLGRAKLEASFATLRTPNDG